MAKQLRFSAEILSADRGGAFVEIPYDLDKEWGSKRPQVKATFDGEPYRGTALKMGTECYVLLILKGIRAKIGKDVGDKVRVVMEVDTDERVVNVPAELEKALKKNKIAREAFAKASYTTRKEFAVAVSGAKTDATRERRIAHVIEQLTARAKDGEMPEELAKALKKSKKASAAFQAMPPSHRKQHIGHILEARQTATRTKRAERAVEMILEWAANQSKSN